MTSPLRILLVEDSTQDAELIQELLEADHFVCEVTRVQTRAEFLAALEDGGFDLVLSDYKLPSFDGLSALKLTLNAHPDLPFIFVSGFGEEIAIEALTSGAKDYVLKTGLSRLVPAVQRALREARERAERKKPEEALLRILLLEDSVQDAELIQELLEADHFVCEVTRVQTRAEFLAALEDGGFDLILADYKLPSFDGLSALKLALSARPDLPFIFVSGFGEEIAIEALTSGATDYILKTRLSRLVPSVQRALREARERAERKKAEEALRRSETYLAEAQRIAHVGWWERDLSTNHVSVSDEGCRIFGVQPLDLPDWRERWLQLIHPDDRPRAAEAAAAALRGSRRYDIEYRVARPDGAVRIVHSQGDVTWDELGRPLRQFGVLQDITELRQAEHELRASEARFRTFVDHATDAFFLLDDQSTILDVNRQACDSLGYGREELIGMRRDSFDVGLYEAPVQRLRQRMAAGEILTFETRHRRKDGTVFPVEVRSGQFEQGGRRFLALVRDITERKRAEEERERLRQLEADLARINRVSMMGELAASLAHEIRQPIAAAIIAANACMRWLGRDRPNVIEARGAAAAMVAAVTRGAGIIDRVRSLYGRGTAEREVVDLNEILREMTVLLGDTADRHSISIHTELDVGVPRATADRVQLQQVLMNLMLNGIEAMRETGGELTIASKRTEHGQLLVTVSDSGIGLPVDEAERIFDAFFTTKPQGTGMGLSISRRIIESHGGRLWASPNAGRGAILQFTLPGE